MGRILAERRRAGSREPDFVQALMEALYAAGYGSRITADWVTGLPRRGRYRRGPIPLSGGL